MALESFDKRKKDVLGKSDKSSKNNWDEKIIPLCNKINSLKDYYTTSSCSGRIVLIMDFDKKVSNLFLYVSHDKINLKEFKKTLERASKNKNKNKTIIFKQEPCGLHIACRTLKDAQIILDKAKKVGWKKSGIISSSKRFIVEILGTEKLEFPIMGNKKILVNDIFLNLIINRSNDNLEKSWKKINNLNKIL